MISAASPEADLAHDVSIIIIMHRCMIHIYIYIYIYVYTHMFVSAKQIKYFSESIVGEILEKSPHAIV